jgi:hypothetical protein
MADPKLLEDIKTEAMEIADYVSRLRAETRTPGVGKLMTMSELVGERDVTDSLWRPTGADKPHELYELGLRYWAQRVAPQIDSDEFENLVEQVADAQPDFDGDVIRFFENLFEGLRFSDGAVCYP